MFLIFSSYSINQLEQIHDIVFFFFSKALEKITLSDKKQSIIFYGSAILI